MSAQGGDTEYYILGDEADILAALQAIPNSDAAGNINSRLSIVSSADGVNVYLDEWEDTYDFHPDDPSTADATWSLNEGGVHTWTEADTFVTGSQGVDGGDRLYVTEAPVSVVRTVWPDDPGPYLAGSWELYPIQSWQSSYVVPVGEDLGPFSGSPDPFMYTFLFIEAEENNTQVVVTDPDPTIGVRTNAVLNQGDNIYLDHINAGTTVSATSSITPGLSMSIQAGLITSVNGVYDSRYYTLTPEEFLGNEYYLPVPSMQFPVGEFGGRDVNTAAYIYAFQDSTVVNIETSAGMEPPVALDTGQVHRYVMPRLPRDELPQGPYGARITVNDPGPDDKIWILIAGDDNYPDLDWGYQALNPLYLGDNYYLPFAPANPAYITPVEDDTDFSVDWDNDGVPDPPSPFTLNRFDIRMLFAPDTLDYIGTGAHIYADKRFAMAWGQDNSESTNGEPLPDYDYGYTVLPLEPYQAPPPPTPEPPTPEPPTPEPPTPEPPTPEPPTPELPAPTLEPPTPTPESPEPGPPAPTPASIPPTPEPPTPTVEVLAVAMLPETGGLPGRFTVVLGVPLIMGAAGLLNLTLLAMRGRRGDGKGD